ncbi:MAG: AbrB/MazE/SpoVT family DNA-binding domain-containing protein [Candidatus Paracaedibacter sp.]
MKKSAHGNRHAYGHLLRQVLGAPNVRLLDLHNICAILEGKICRLTGEAQMDVKTVVSAKGQVVIPKLVRDTMGLHSGSEFIIHLREDSVLEFKQIKKNLADFFGMGAKRGRDLKTTPVNIDEAIAEAVMDNNKHLQKDS